MVHVVRRGLLAVLAALCLLAVVATPSVGAQADCYPDGCTEPTNPQPRADAACALTVGTGRPGDAVTARVRNSGTGPVRLLFSGSEVANAAADVGAAVLSFVVPPVGPGTYSVVAVGNDFSVECTFGDDAGFAVLAAGVTQGGAANGGSANSGSASGGVRALAFTGFDVLLLVAIGLALLAIGWYLVRRSREPEVAPVSPRSRR